LAIGLLVANVVRYNANDNPTKQSAFSQYDRPKARCRYAEIAESLGLGGRDNDEKVERLIAWIEGLKRDLEIPISIQAAGVPEADFLGRLDHIAIESFDDQCTGANPRYPLIGELRSILLDSYYGRPFIEFAGRDLSQTLIAPGKDSTTCALE
jgi:acetaldehyde dehydrogenase/alcohol dehydrogenase